ASLHGLVDGEPHPCSDDGAQSSDLSRPIRHEQDALPALYPATHGEWPLVPLLQVLECRQRRSSHGANGSEHPYIFRLQEGLRGSAGDERAEFFVWCHEQQPPQLTSIATTGFMTPSHDGCYERARVTTPFPPRRIIPRGNQPPHELLDVVALLNLRKRAPVRGFFLEGVENDVAAKSVPKFQQVAPVGIRDDRAVATCECR